MNILLQIEAKAVKNASSLHKFSGHSELENGLFVFLSKGKLNPGGGLKEAGINLKDEGKLAIKTHR